MEPEERPQVELGCLYLVTKPAIESARTDVRGYGLCQKPNEVAADGSRR
jgi:hypothetical protein